MTLLTRRTILLDILRQRSPLWTQTPELREAYNRNRCETEASSRFAADLKALVKSGDVEREAVPGMTTRYRTTVYSYRMVTK